NAPPRLHNSAASTMQRRPFATDDIATLMQEKNHRSTEAQRIQITVLVFSVSLCLCGSIWIVPGALRLIQSSRPACPPLELMMTRLLGLSAIFLLPSLLYCQQPMVPKIATPYWNVDDVKPGMKGQGKSVVKGVKI